MTALQKEQGDYISNTAHSESIEHTGDWPPRRGKRPNGKPEANASYLERKVSAAFVPNDRIRYQNTNYTVKLSGKPDADKGGEGKTDAYILLVDEETAALREIKISIKDSNADMIENKIGKDRMNQIFPKERQAEISSQAIEVLQARIDSGEYMLNNGVPDENGQRVLTVGFLADLVEQGTAGANGVDFEATVDEVIEAWSGANLKLGQRHSSINGEKVENSGVANAILKNKDSSFLGKDRMTAQKYILDNCISIEDYAEDPANRVLRFKLRASNFGKGSRDHRRPMLLRVGHTFNPETGQVDSFIVDEEMHSHHGKEVQESDNYDIIDIEILEPTRKQHEEIARNK